MKKATLKNEIEGSDLLEFTIFIEKYKDRFTFKAIIRALLPRARINKVAFKNDLLELAKEIV